MSAAAAIMPTASQQASAACHLERRSEWTFYRVAGVRYVAMQSATSGKTYTVRADGQGCSCRFYAVHQSLCSHALAVIEAANQDAIAEWLADQADMLLDQYDAQQRPATAWKYCSRKCGELLAPEHIGPLCDHCWAKAKRLLDMMDDE